MSLASDAHLVLNGHERRIGELEVGSAKIEATLDRHGYLMAALDRSEAKMLAQVKAQFEILESKVCSQFRELREEIGRSGR